MGHAGDLNKWVRDSLTKQVTSGQQSVGGEGGCHQGKSFPGSGKCQYKGPEVRYSREEAGMFGAQGGRESGSR